MGDKPVTHLTNGTATWCGRHTGDVARSTTAKDAYSCVACKRAYLSWYRGLRVGVRPSGGTEGRG